MEQTIIENSIYKEFLTLQITPTSEAKLNQYLQIIGKVLEVDKELNPEVLTKSILIKKNKNLDCIQNQESVQLKIQFESTQLKVLRSCISGFFKHMQLVAKTIKQLGPIH